MLNCFLILKNNSLAYYFYYFRFFQNSPFHTDAYPTHYPRQLFEDEDFEKLEVFNDCWRTSVFKCVNKTNKDIKSNSEESAKALLESNKPVLGGKNFLAKSCTNWGLENHMPNKNSLQSNANNQLVLLGTQGGWNPFAWKEPSYWVTILSRCKASITIPSSWIACFHPCIQRTLEDKHYYFIL